jgi:hypothetical protein
VNFECTWLALLASHSLYFSGLRARKAERPRFDCGYTLHWGLGGLRPQASGLRGALALSTHFQHSEHSGNTFLVIGSLRLRASNRLLRAAALR